MVPVLIGTCTGVLYRTCRADAEIPDFSAVLDLVGCVGMAMVCLV